MRWESEFTLLKAVIALSLDGLISIYYIHIYFKSAQTTWTLALKIMA